MANQFLKKSPVNTRQLFTFFDRNKDWKISKKELEKAKTKTLVNYLGLPKPKK